MTERRTFIIWNRGYKQQCVVAIDANEALKISMESGHMRRLNAYRRFLDVTEHEEYSADAQAAMAADRSGVVTKNADGELLIGGIPI